MLQLTLKETRIEGFEKGLFWANMPFKPKNNLDFLGKLILKTFCRYKDNPFLIYTGDRYIDFSVFYNNTKYFNKIKKQKHLEIFLYEPISYYLDDKKYTNGYYSEMHSDYNGELGSEELDSISEFQKKTGLQITVNTCDYNIKDILQSKYENLNLVCNDIFIRSNNVYHKNIFTGKNDISKKFWCGNGRYTPHRHIMSAYLQDKLGNYSWHYQANIEDVKDLPWVENILPWSYLKGANKKLNDNLPYIDTTQQNYQTINDVTACFMPNFPMDASELLFESYRQSFCAVVNETRFAVPTGNISEKVLYAISFKTPFVLVASPKSLEYLKKLGFKTFDFLWDESYDQEINHSKRLLKIFQVINKINSYSLEDMKEIYFSKEVQDVVDYNRAHLRTLPITEVIL